MKYKSKTFVSIEKTQQDFEEVSSAGHKETEQETKYKLLPGVWGAPCCTSTWSLRSMAITKTRINESFYNKITRDQNI